MLLPPPPAALRPLTAGLAAGRQPGPGRERTGGSPPAAGPARSGGVPPGLPLILGLALLLPACAPAERRASGRVFPLPRQQPHDGLAVVTRPAGEGLHLWLDPDTSEPGRCSPRWNPDAARLQGGDGPHPRSGGRAPRAEFYAAMARGPVRWQLRQLFTALCRQVAPQRRFVWVEPPRSAAEHRAAPLPMLEERHLLSHPSAIRRAEKRLLGQPLTAEDWREEEPHQELPAP